MEDAFTSEELKPPVFLKKLQKPHIMDFSKPLRPPPDFGPIIAVFWDLADFPIPTDDGIVDNSELIYESFNLAAERKGYNGDMRIWVYAANIPLSDELLDKYWKAGIYFLPNVPEDKTARANRIIEDVHLLALDFYPPKSRDPPAVIVISQDIQADLNFNYSLSNLNLRRFNCFLAQASNPETSSAWPGCLIDGGVVVGKFLKET